MCGINGIFQVSGTVRYEFKQLVSKMNDEIQHRGPDDEGIFCEPNNRFCIGHRRLSIIDITSRGHQPMIMPDGTAIVFNGEIYNFRYLKEKVKNYKYTSDSDTELLLALYQEKGESLLNDIEGMFVFAIWDPQRRGFFIARDRIGKKPFYYSFINGIFSFSSEIRALLSLPWIERSIDEKAFYYFLTFGFNPPPYSMFQGIYKLEQGHSFWIDYNGLSKPNRYWSIDFHEVPRDENKLVELLRQRLDHAIDLRMVSDVPVGVFLSGGVDSTAVATLVKQRTQKKLRSFSVGFEGQVDYDESREASLTSSRLGFDHYERIITKKELLSMIGTVSEIFDEPLADPTCIPIYFLAEMAKESGTKVVLTGDGPDELFLSYRNWHRYIMAYPLYRAYQKLPNTLRTFAYQLAKQTIRSQRLLELMHRASYNHEFFWGRAPSFKDSVKVSLLSSDYAQRSSRWECHELVRKLRDEYVRLCGPTPPSDSGWMAYIGLCFIIPNYYLHRSDRLGMWHSIELRAPFLDHNFANLSLSIPYQWKRRHCKSKYIFKRALAGLVSKDVLFRRKRGFCVPLREWAGDLMVERIMSDVDRFCTKTDFFNKKAIIELINRFRNGEYLLLNDVWSIFYMMNWMQKWKHI